MLNKSLIKYLARHNRIECDAWVWLHVVILLSEWDAKGEYEMPVR